MKQFTKTKRENSSLLKADGYKLKKLKGVEYWYKEPYLFKRELDNSLGTKVGEKKEAGYTLYDS
jgi:hypothetical protein